MERREILAGLGGLGVLGVGGATAFGYLDPFSQDTDEERIEPHTLQQIAAPGSVSGEVTVPEPGTVTYIAFFATWCGTCQTKMDPLGEAAAAVDEDVQFISVTIEPIPRATTPEDVAQWWREYDGNWPVAYDEGIDFEREFGAIQVPYSYVLDSENRITWSSAGYKTAEEILDPIREARDVGPE